jgi:ABC-type dipeptide/oligopeptide/nickel transport system permease subunit
MIVSSRRVRRFLRNVPALIAGVYLALLILASIFATTIAPYNPRTNHLSQRFVRPLHGHHLLGTDALGRDIFSNLLVASRWSLRTGLGTVLIALVVAIPLGLAAGYLGRAVDAVITRLTEVLLSIPPIILAFAIVGTLGPNLRNTVIALGVLFVPTFVRLIRNEVRIMRQGQLVEAERALGAPDRYILWRHILPNVSAPIIVQSSLTIGFAILAESGLSFVGLGPKPPTKSWGVMLADFYNELIKHPWMVFIPGIAIALAVLAFNILGDGLRDALGKVEP